jgi:DNA-binding NarL/FixJ family response regulator
LIRVLVDEDHPVVRHGLVSLLRYEPTIKVLGAAEDGAQAVELIMELQPDVVLLDLRLPRLGGVEVMQQIRSQGLATRFLALTTYDTDQYIAPALAAGAQGHLLKDATPEELARGIQAVMQGGAALEPSVAARILGRMQEENPADELSAREREVLSLLVAGVSNKQIAAQLNLSENTIKTHLSRIFAKLNAQSRAEAVATALTKGLVSPPIRG